MKTDKRSRGGHAKKACLRCGHGIAIHHTKHGPSGFVRPCNHPGCGCKNYQRPEAR